MGEGREKRYHTGETQDAKLPKMYGSKNKRAICLVGVATGPLQLFTLALSWTRSIGMDDLTKRQLRIVELAQAAIEKEPHRIKEILMQLYLQGILDFEKAYFTHDAVEGAQLYRHFRVPL